MHYGNKRLAWLALGLVAVLVASPGPPLQAQDLVPVGYWALDDGQSNPFALTAADSSASGNTGTLWASPSQPTWATGIYGGALKFDGTDDGVDMGSPASLDITGAVSMSFWMGRLGPNTQTYATLVGKNYSGGSAYDAYYVNSQTNSQLVFGITPAVGDPVTLTSNALVPNGAWHHVVTTFDPGNRMAIYVDGVLDSELTTGVPNDIRSVTSPFTLGNLGAGSTSKAYCYNGYLDEVKVFNGVLGLPQIQSLATPPAVPPGDPTPAVLVAHWKLDDGQIDPNTTTAVDTTATASNGTLLNFDAPPAWDNNGKTDGALSFDGSNDRVDMGASSELDSISGDLSMTFWLKPNGAGAAKYGALVGKNMSGGQESDAFFTDIVYTKSVTNAIVPAGTIEFAVTTSDGVTGTNTVARSNTALSLTDDTWHHVAVTYDDGSRMAIYIDGVLDAELTLNVPESCATPFATPFSLGNLSPEDPLNPPAYGYKGMIDDVQLYTGVLTAEQIRAMVPMVPGDATGDGFVDQADAAILATNWGSTVTGASNGDFNGDNVVNAADASILAANWNPAPPTEAAGVPEPTALVLLAAGLLGLLIPRHRS